MLSVPRTACASSTRASLEVYGQELNAETYAICRSDMMLKGQDATNIAYGNSFSEDGHPGLKVDYSIQNPPFGVEWKKVADAVKDEHNDRGLAGRFGAGLPRINDGSFLFLQNAISKMKPVADGGSRVAIVFNGSPLFTGAAGSGESEIRRWIIENDWLEAVVALPDQLFYNTGISTYFWIVTNRKDPKRRGKVQLIDARNCFVKMRKSLGEKRKQISDTQIADIVRAYGEFTEVDGGSADDNGGDPEPSVKVFPNETFGFLRITVERPLRLRWEITDEGVEALRADKKFAKLTEDDQNSIIADLGHSIGTHETDSALRDLVVDSLTAGYKQVRSACLDLLELFEMLLHLLLRRVAATKRGPPSARFRCILAVTAVVDLHTRDHEAAPGARQHDQQDALLLEKCLPLIVPSSGEVALLEADHEHPVELLTLAGVGV
jgi:type I restriction enzyme M protein